MTTLPMLPAYPEHLQQRGGSPDLLEAELMHVIKDAIVNHPRSLQKRIGPSEIGHECPRRIAYTLLGVGPFNPFPDVPWLPTIGTATHGWLEDKFGLANDPDSAYARWLLEMRVSVGEILGVEITGAADVYDQVTCTVVDWKVVGATPLKKYRSKGPGQQYRCQGHLYGRGFVRRGVPVDRVMIVFLPRNGELRDAYVWSEPYDEAVALWALERANGIAIAAAALGTDVLDQLQPVEAFCRRCPFFNPGSTDLATGCPGVDVAQPAPAIGFTKPAQS